MTDQLQVNNRNSEYGVSSGATRKKPNFAHLASNMYSYRALEMVYQDKVAPEKEPHLVQLVRDVERIVSGDGDLATERVVLDGIVTLGSNVVLKYLLGFKLAILIPVFEARVSNDDVNIRSELNGLQKLRTMIHDVQRWAESIH